MDVEIGEEMLVCGVLGLSFDEIDGVAFDEGEFALSESGAYGASYGG